MIDARPLSPQTRKNWQINAILFASALLAALSGVYFLYLPAGFQGGRNPAYELTILFSRSAWDHLHTWSGTAMIVIAAAHLTSHRSWVIGMTRRVFKEARGQCGCMNRRARFNLALNGVLGLSFALTALSGFYFLLFPLGGRSATDPQLLFSRLVWDLVHTWSGVIMILAALVHLGIHWQWVVKVTRRYLHNPKSGPTTPAAKPVHMAQEPRRMTGND